MTRQERLRSILLEIRKTRTSPVAIAEELNRRRIKTERSGQHWHALHVVRVMQRLGLKAGELVVAVRSD
jgi:hypothetical protein